MYAKKARTAWRKFIWVINARRSIRINTLSRPEGRRIRNLQDFISEVSHPRKQPDLNQLAT